MSFFLTGDINELKKQHDKDMEEYERTQELNKARMDQGLQDRLRQRRSRRRRDALQAAESAAAEE